MRLRHTLFAVPAFLLLLAAAPVRAQAPVDPSRNEITVFGGISILDAHGGSSYTIALPSIPGFPGFPGLPDLGDVQVNTETKLGSSAVFGARYAFYLKKQLALEADFSVAPTHDLTGNVGVCGPGGRCYGGADFDQSGMAESFTSAMGAFFGGPMGGRFRGMGGMRGGRLDGGRGFGGQNVTAWHYGAGVTYDILGGDVRPFVMLGAGAVTYDGARATNTDFVLRFGGGLKAYFGRVGLRVDAADYVVVDQYLSGRTEHDVHATGGVLVRF
jgi:hypothetical protein